MNMIELASFQEDEMKPLKINRHKLDIDFYENLLLLCCSVVDFKRKYIVVLLQCIFYDFKAKKAHYSKTTSRLKTNH